MNIIRKASSLTLAFMMVFAIIMAGAQQTSYAELVETNELSASKTAEKVGTNEFDVTFSLPSKSVVVEDQADVVILMDKSSVSDLAGLKTAAASFIDKLVAKEADGVNFKVAVVWFNFNVYNGDATSTGLVDLTADNADAIKASIKDGGGSGSNLHGGVIRAKDILDADTTVTDTNKFLIIATDLAGYAVDKGDGTGCVRYNGSNCFGNMDLVNKYGGLDLSGTTSDDIDELIKNKRLLNGTTADDTMLTTIGSTVGEFPYQAESGNTKTFADYMVANCPTMFEKNIYLTGNLFLDMKDKGYNLVAINQPYTSPYKNYVPINTAYQKWFGENVGTRYDLSTGITVDYAFNNIAAEVMDLLGKGTITDVIADDFELKSPSTMRVIYDGKEVKKTKLSTNKYGFGTQKDGVYQYVGTYDPATKTVSLDINQPASRYNLLQFVFTEVYSGEKVKVETTLPTNKSAKLDYMNSFDAKDVTKEYNKTFSFESPMVTIVPVYSSRYKFISGTDGKTLPSEVTKLLPKGAENLANGTKVYPKAPTVKTVKTGDGTWTFTGWDKSDKTINSADVIFVGAWIFEKDGANPKTGDNAQLGLMLAAIALCGAGVAGMAYKKRKQSK